jgi:diguanylate cyclase (GGDEF)-like protein
VSKARALALRMSYLAQHDNLTDLPNRILLNDRLTQAMALARRHGRKLAVLFLDGDRFKNINDSLGHAIGDRLLQSVAQRLLDCVRRSDTVSRQGGDEFVILLSEVTHAQDAAVSAEKILVAMSAPHRIDQHDVHLTVSIGIVTYPDDGTDAETLVKNADFAMYDAKNNGRNNYQFFRPDMNVRAMERQSIESGLRDAMERGEFVLHYQPKMNLETGGIIGVEALIRWHHPQRGLVPPVQFIPVAEDCGFIVPIGRWVLHEACRQARAWQDSGLRPVRIAVNVSAVELRANDFVAGVNDVLTETGLDPRYLELELTETFLMQDSKSTVAVLQALKGMGVQLALDDFGTGYSSLSYLKRFPIDTLKIDRSFVRDLTTDADDASIVTAVISMGKSLHMGVVAEGVETREQLAFLQEQSCPEGQGYYFSRPVGAEEFIQLLGAA